MLGESVLLHFIGDYVIQSNWMANEKVNRWFPAVVHGVTYTIPFVLLTQSLLALSIICLTHIVIDKYRLAKHFIWVKNFLAPRRYPKPSWHQARQNGGFPAATPVWLATWLMIIVDNIFHILINLAALSIGG